jgi:hypothetical protein
MSEKTKQLFGKYDLDFTVNENKRESSLIERCREYRAAIAKRNPYTVASHAALAVSGKKDGTIFFSGTYFSKQCVISWPELNIFDDHGKALSLRTEAFWLHYLDRADGHPLSGRWVNLSEIGGLFYQQAFQGYCGDELAAAWGNDLVGLRNSCLSSGGWELKGLGDLAFEWRVLPRLPLCLCYRLPTGTKKAWATMLFDAAANHYVAADVAATAGKKLAESLKPNKYRNQIFSRGGHKS